MLLLANNDPKTFLSGGNIDLERVLQKYNRTEFHHIYPKKYLEKLRFDDNFINCLANFCFLNSAENKSISAKQPSMYVKMMPKGTSLQDILESALCPSNTFGDNFKTFIDERVKLLVAFSKKLIQDESLATSDDDCT